MEWLRLGVVVAVVAVGAGGIEARAAQPPPAPAAPPVPAGAPGPPASAAEASPRYESRLEIVDIRTGARRVIHRGTTRFEAPNWSRDGRHLLINQQGSLYRVSVESGDAGGTALPALNRPLERVDLGAVEGCNNDHGYSPDGTLLAISCRPSSSVYIVSAMGGTPRLLTTRTPSYWHGWSPDGKTVAYVGQRDGEFDIYTMAVEGGPEVRLTSAKGLDDGPDYTPDGQWIYFNSVRTGTMRIWRMRPDGSDQQQVTFDAQYADWFPHPSPDGKWLAWVSFDASVDGHPPYKDVVLRLMPLDEAGAKPRVLFPLFGGQGTINVPSWSPDSTRFAFVSYARLDP
jgi:TolB protein